MERLNYKALYDSGKLKSLKDLVVLFRQEVIAFHKSKASWPRYVPGSKDLDILVWYREARLEGIMDFGTFCVVWKEMDSMNHKAG